MFKFFIFVIVGDVGDFVDFVKVVWIGEKCYLFVNCEFIVFFLV